MCPFLAASEPPPIHPVGWILIILAALFVIGLAGLMIHSAWTNRRPNPRKPEQMLRHHVKLLLLYDDGRHEFKKHARRFAEWHRDLVPPSGRADTIEGEVIRCVDRLASEERRNGNLNWNAGFAKMVRFLRDALKDGIRLDEVEQQEIGHWLDAIERHGSDPQDQAVVYAAFAGLIEAAVRFCERKPMT